MHHPFEKLFDEALRKSVEGENHLTSVVEDLIEKGYQEDEVFRALTHFAKGLIDVHDERIVTDTLKTLEKGVAD